MLLCSGIALCCYCVAGFSPQKSVRDVVILMDQDTRAMVWGSGYIVYSYFHLGKCLYVVQHIRNKGENIRRREHSLALSPNIPGLVNGLYG